MSAPIFLTSLPGEILFEILCFLNTKDLVSISLTCKNLEDISNDNILWKHVHKSLFGECITQKENTKWKAKVRQDWFNLDVAAFKFHWCSANGSPQLFEALLKNHPHEFDLAEKDAKNNLIFFRACEAGNTPMIVYLLGQYKEHFESIRPTLFKSFTVACHNGHSKATKAMIPFLGEKEIFQYMISDVITKNHTRNPIFLACTENRVDVVKLLLNIFKKFNSEAHIGPILDLCVSECCEGGNLELVHTLLTNGGRITPRSVYVTCAKGHLDILKLLNYLEPDVVKKNLRGSIHGLTPLQAACQEGHVEIVTELLPIVDANEENWTGWRAIHYACQGGHLDVVKALIEIGKCDYMSPPTRKSRNNQENVQSLTKFGVEEGSPLDIAYRSHRGGAAEVAGYLEKVDVGRQKNVKIILAVAVVVMMTAILAAATITF